MTYLYEILRITQTLKAIRVTNSIILQMKTYKRYRYPSQIISHAVWLYHRFTLSFCDIEDILAARGVIVSKRRNKKAALKFFRRLFRTQPRKPRAIIAEISHQKVRQQHRQMRNFKSIKHAQKFLANHTQSTRFAHGASFGLINNLFRHQRHLAKASTYRILREESFETWTQTSCAQNLVIA